MVLHKLDYNTLINSFDYTVINFLKKHLPLIGGENDEIFIIVLEYLLYHLKANNLRIEKSKGIRWLPISQ